MAKRNRDWDSDEPMSIKDQLADMVDYLSGAAARYQEAEDGREDTYDWDSYPKVVRDMREEIDQFREDAWGLVDELEAAIKKAKLTKRNPDDDDDEDDEDDYEPDDRGPTIGRGFRDDDPYPKSGSSISDEKHERRQRAQELMEEMERDEE